VRKVVPTLTSKSAEIYLLMAGAKQLVTRGLSWFRPRPRGGSLQACRVVLTTCSGMANLASGKASWRALYPSRSGFEGSGVGTSRLVVVRTLT
jgi:hypothetical protein